MRLTIPQPEAQVLDYFINRAGLLNASGKEGTKAAVISMMQFSEFRNCQLAELASDIQESLALIITHSLANRDWQFFVRLGRALDKPAVSLFDVSKSLPFLILAGWEHSINDGGKEVSLRECSDDVITSILSVMLNNPALTLDSVTKARQRLKLPKNGNPKFTKFKQISKTEYRLS